MEFKNRLKEFIEEHEITARKLSETLDIDHTSIYLYLQGSYPNIKNAVKLANYFNCTLNFLFGIDGYPDEYEFFKTYDASMFLERYLNQLNKNELTHYKVIKKLGLGNSSFAKWKAGREPKIETLIKLSNLLNCSIDYLIGRSSM